jgi:hypothetical protein
VYGYEPNTPTVVAGVITVAVEVVL